MWHDKHNPKVDKEATFVVAAVVKRQKYSGFASLKIEFSQEGRDPTNTAKAGKHNPIAFCKWSLALIPGA